VSDAKELSNSATIIQRAGSQTLCLARGYKFTNLHSLTKEVIMANITFLGTGLLGSAFAEATAKRGDTVTVWNRSIEKAQALQEFGIKVAPSVARAVKGADRVHLVLKDDAVVEEVIAAAGAELSKDTVLIDHSTTLPALTATRLERLNAQGIKYLHCPVFMGPVHARNAQGSMLVAGPKALFEQVKAGLAVMTGRLEYLGERGDIAAVNKLMGNAMIIGLTGITADVLTIAQAANVNAEDAITLLKMLDLNAMLAGRGVNMAKGNFAASFELTMARKDVQLMLSTTGNRPMAVLPCIASRMDKLIEQGHGAMDASVIGFDAVKPL
jgi:3-hydroxyisobutyrate dehydrogenase-like beta-hydroxyacid dehydrogenase